MNESLDQNGKRSIVITGWKAVVSVIGIVMLIGGIFVMSALDSNKEAVMTNVQGMDVPKAVKALKQDNFKKAKNKEITFRAPFGSILDRDSMFNICEQSPAAGETTKRGVKIDLTIAKDCSTISSESNLSIADLDIQKD